MTPDCHRYAAENNTKCWVLCKYLTAGKIFLKEGIKKAGVKGACSHLWGSGTKQCWAF